MQANDKLIGQAPHVGLQLNAGLLLETKSGIYILVIKNAPVLCGYDICSLVERMKLVSTTFLIMTSKIELLPQRVFVIKVEKVFFDS